MLPNIRGKSLEDDCLTPDLLSQILFSLEVEEIENPQYMYFISGPVNFTRDSCSVGVAKGARSTKRRNVGEGSVSKKCFRNKRLA